MLYTIPSIFFVVLSVWRTLPMTTDRIGPFGAIKAHWEGLGSFLELAHLPEFKDP